MMSDPINVRILIETISKGRRYLLGFGARRYISANADIIEIAPLYSRSRRYFSYRAVIFLEALIPTFYRRPT